MTNAEASHSGETSLRSRLVEGLEEIFRKIPDVATTMEVGDSPLLQELEMDVWAHIPKLDEDGFDVSVQFFDGWELNILTDESSVDFFLLSKPRHAERNRKQVEAALALVACLLTPSCRLRQWYRGPNVYRGRIERLVEGRWQLVAGYGRVLWFRDFTKPRVERVLQNRHLPVGDQRCEGSSWEGG